MRPPCGYGVNYGFAGFFTPVDPNPTMNGANSGQAYKNTAIKGMASSMLT